MVAFPLVERMAKLETVKMLSYASLWAVGVTLPDTALAAPVTPELFVAVAVNV